MPLLWVASFLGPAAFAAAPGESSARAAGQSRHSPVVRPQNTPAGRASHSAATVKLAENGRALLPVVVAASASPRVQELATTLADYLGRISGAEFKTETRADPLTAEGTGIAIGVSSQFPAMAAAFDTADPTRREDYILRSHTAGAVLVGATELAVQHAVWDFLYHLGHRQYFPGPLWEVVPRNKNLSIAIDVTEHPDYYARRFGPSFGTVPENRDKHLAWDARNRIGAGIDLKTGHAYDAIIRRNKAEFERHPEYLANPLGSPGLKFCVSNPELRQLVVKDALAQLERNPALQSISVDPSDGGYWESGSCPDDEVYKNITDRAVALANAVAEAVEKKYPGTVVGMYAYNDHSPPPTIAVHPNVVVSVATAFIRGGNSVDELIAGWSKKAKVLGIREYYSVHTWDRDMPGQARGGDVEYLKKTIPHFYQNGARFMTSEASDNWGPNGLGYYIATRLLWDVDEAKRVPEIEAEFLDKMFGAARGPMSEYYRLISDSGRPLLSSDLFGRMYRHLNDAFHKSDDPAVRARLRDLTLYTRYAELFQTYSQAAGPARQQAFEATLRFGWRIRGTQMIDAIALFRDVAPRDKQVVMPQKASYSIAEPENPWKSSEPFTPEQVQAFIDEGIANNALIDFKPVQYSRDLVPAAPLRLTSGKPGSYVMSRGKHELYTWVEKAPSTISLQTRAGIVYGTLGDARFSLYPQAQTLGESVAEEAVKPDKEPHTVKLASGLDGMHRIELLDGGAGTELSWAAGTPMTMESSPASPSYFAGGRWSLYFYVPKGTRVVGGYRDRNGSGAVLDGNGALVKTLTAEGAPGYWSVPVAPGQDGKLWKLDNIPGQIMLMTVPPFLAKSAEELMLPREVVAADLPK